MNLGMYPKTQRIKLASLMLLLLVSGLLVAGSASVALAEIRCRADVNRTSVPVGGDVILTVTAEGSVDWSADFQLPSMPGVSIRVGGTNQSMSFINGQSSTTISKTYYLHVEQDKNFVIGSIKVSSADGTGQSEPISITVIAADKPAAVSPSYSGNRVRNPSSPAPVASPAAGDDIFVTLEIDQDEVWVGQQVILSFKYWHRGQSWSSPSYQAPKTEGFWREDIGKERSYRRSYKGWTYNVTEIKYALFPTRSGSLIIEPAVIELSGSNGFFFGSRRRTQAPKIYKTDLLTIKVKPLPLPRPAGFSGIAGTSLELVGKANRADIPAGESITYTIEMLTDGFLKGFAGLTVEAPEGCRLHDGSEELEMLVGGSRQQDKQRLIGRYRQETFIVPGTEGDLEIPGQEISWFNVRKGNYQTTRTARAIVNVTAGRPGVGGGEVSGFRRSEIERLGQDLAFIRQAPDQLAHFSPVPMKTPLYWICIVLPLLALASWRVYMNKLASDRRNPANIRRRQALSVALAGLKRSENLPDNEERYGAVSRVVAGYVADILDRPVAAISGLEVCEFCGRLGLDDHGRQLESFLQASDSARYGGGVSSVGASAAEVKTWISDLDGAFKKQASGRGNSTHGKIATLVIFAFLGLASANSVWAEGPGPDPVRLLAEGNQAYTAGEITLATELYSQALDRGADDAILHYNLGNAYARQGQLGQAVVSYLRARRLSPLDKDIAGNLRWIRSQLKDMELEDASLPLFIAEVVTVVGWLTLAQWSFIPLAILWILAVQIGWGWYKDEFNPNLRRILIATVALLVMTSGITGWRYYLEEIRNQAVIVVSEAPVHSGPADSYPVLFEIHDGLTINISEFRDGWVRMDLGGQWQGWVPAETIEQVRKPRN